jgi:hypothetical protein
MSLTAKLTSSQGLVIDISIEVITPDMAAIYLKGNTMNRPMNRKRMQAYAAQMSSGVFDGMNGDAIRIATDGTILDGQKRLSAIIQSGIALETLVIRGIRKASFMSMDRGEIRTNGQLFAIQKVENYNAIAAVLHLLWRYGQRRFVGDLSVRPSYNELESLFSANDISESVRFARKSRDIRKLVATAMIGFCHYAFSQSSKSHTQTFFEKLNGQLPTTRLSPVYLLKERLVDNRASKSKLKQPEMLALWIKAFNAHLLDAEIKVLRWSSGQNEKFPSIEGFSPSDVKFEAGQKN